MQPALECDSPAGNFTVGFSLSMDFLLQDDWDKVVEEYEGACVFTLPVRYVFDELVNSVAEFDDEDSQYMAIAVVFREYADKIEAKIAAANKK